jgi:hypothetical protein
MQMLEIAGFPTCSQEFAELEMQAIQKLKDRDRAYYLAFLESQV